MIYVSPGAVESDAVIVGVQDRVVDGQLVGHTGQEFFVGSERLMSSRIQLPNSEAYIAEPTGCNCPDFDREGSAQPSADSRGVR